MRLRKTSWEKEICSTVVTLSLSVRPPSAFVVDDVSVFAFYFGSTNGIFRILTSLFTFISTIYLYAAIQTFARLNGLLSMCSVYGNVDWALFLILFSFKPVRVLSIYIFILTRHFMFISIFRYERQQKQLQQ